MAAAATSRDGSALEESKDAKSRMGDSIADRKGSLNKHGESTIISEVQMATGETTVF